MYIRSNFDSSSATSHTQVLSTSTELHDPIAKYCWEGDHIARVSILRTRCRYLHSSDFFGEANTACAMDAACHDLQQAKDISPLSSSNTLTHSSTRLLLPTLTLFVLILSLLNIPPWWLTVNEELHDCCRIQRRSRNVVNTKKNIYFHLSTIIIIS